MIAKLFRRRSTAPASAASIPEGERVYAVGDVHGRLDLLDDLLIMIAEDNKRRGPAKTTVVFLGDLIDRGPESARVVERLRKLVAAGEPLRFLIGNHEEVFLAALREDGTKALRFFCRIGGRETILSYGIEEDEYRDLDYPELKDALLASVPEEHLAFFDTFENMIVIGDYCFVHAGIRPDVPLDDQKLSDLRWIREAFLAHERPHSHVVVHGHTILEEIDWQPNRIGIDTGAYATGRLSAIMLQGEARQVLQTAGDPGNWDDF